MAAKVYQVNVSDSSLAELKQKLASAKLPDELEGAGWDMGTPVGDMKRLVGYWKDGFDWRQVEREINQMPQFQTSIHVDGFEPLNIHFVHQESPVSGAVPLLFSHGWPGNFLEVKKLLPLLNGNGKDELAFHVVAPSLPNFGFSEGPKTQGFGLQQYAETCHKLMQQLGYQEYVTQGGDWGFHITRAIGFLYPKSCKASHLNVNEGGPPSFWKNPILWLQHLVTPYSAHERAGIKRTKYHENYGMGYNIEQQTKPQTLAFALSDSPVGLLSWIYEKMHGWTDDYPWTDDDILTWVSIYWFSTAGVAANLRIYYEVVNGTGSRNGVHHSRLLEYIPSVKYGISHFPMDISVAPNANALAMGNIVLQTRNPNGGHFAAVEHPEIVSRDLQTMLGKGGKAYGCVTGKSGYSQ